MPELFATVPENDVCNFYEEGKLNEKKVVDFLGYGRRDVAKATGVSERSIRYDLRIPQELKEHLVEWATAINLVGNFLRDAEKTAIWFQIPNPLLGNISPRDMIRIGRFKKLLKFIYNSIGENVRQVKKPSHAKIRP